MKVGRLASPAIRDAAADLVAEYRQLRDDGAFTPEGAERFGEDGKPCGRHIANPNMPLFALDNLAKHGTFIPKSSLDAKNALAVVISESLSPKEGESRKAATERMTGLNPLKIGRIKRQIRSGRFSGR
jgi:hypothetical protein